MDRRTALIAITSAGGLVFAERALAAAPGGQAMLGTADIEHARKTATVGSVSLQAANIALHKAHTPKVAEFAKFEHDEQTTVAAILKSMDPKLIPVPDPMMEAGVKKLSAMPAGRAFEKAFVMAQIEGHEALLQIQNTYLGSGLSPAGTYVTMLATGMIKGHLALLSDLRKAMSRG